jgi:hypothetical protein
MVDSIMYQQDGYVVLETNQPEQLLTELELLNKLENILTSVTEIPQDVSKFNSKAEQAKYLLENYCEFNLDENHYLQWYVVRWEKR